MKNLLPSLSVLVLVTLFGALLVQAGDTTSVSATVTAQNVSLSVSDGAIAYGSIVLGGITSTTGTINESQDVYNNGTVNETFNGKTVTTTIWYEDDTNDALNKYYHRFCNASCDGGSPTWSNMNMSTYTQVSTGTITFGSTTTLDFLIGVPNASSNYNQQSPNITLQAVAA